MDIFELPNKISKIIPLFHKFSLTQQIILCIAAVPILIAVIIKILKLFRKEILWDNLSHKIGWLIMVPVIVILILSSIFLWNIPVFDYKIDYKPYRFAKDSSKYNYNLIFAIENNSDLETELDVILFFKINKDCISKDTAFRKNIIEEPLENDDVSIRMAVINVPADDVTITRLPLDLKYLSINRSIQFKSTALTKNNHERYSLLVSVNWDENDGLHFYYKPIVDPDFNVFKVENNMYLPNPWKSTNMTKNSFVIEKEINKNIQISLPKETPPIRKKEPQKNESQNKNASKEQRKLSDSEESPIEDQPKKIEDKKKQRDLSDPNFNSQTQTQKKQRELSKP